MSLRTIRDRIDRRQLELAQLEALELEELRRIRFARQLWHGPDVPAALIIDVLGERVAA